MNVNKEFVVKWMQITEFNPIKTIWSHNEKFMIPSCVHRHAISYNAVNMFTSSLTRL